MIRTWNTEFRGKILIHAPLAKDNRVMYRLKFKNLPTGAIIGEARIVNIHEIVQNNDKLQHKLGLRKNRKYEFIFEDFKKFKNPIPQKGATRIWNLEL